jgi:hypothetical protein
MSSSTANDVITKALRRIGVIEYDQAPDAAMASQGLAMLNEWMHGLPNVSVDYAHRDLAITDTVNVPDGLVAALITAFGGELADEYERVLTPRQMQRVDMAMNTLRAAYFQPTTAPVDGALRRSGWYNFATDRSGTP